MANYCCTVRSNYFHVKDEAAFLDMMSHVYGCEDEVDLWREKDKNGNPVFGFGAYGGIAGFRELDDEDDVADDTAYDDFIDRLQQLVADGDAVIILESGNEKLRYIVGAATIITSTDCKRLDITQLAAEKAAEMLKKPSYQTKCEY